MGLEESNITPARLDFIQGYNTVYITPYEQL
jgi:hypothetical protein